MVFRGRPPRRRSRRKDESVAAAPLLSAAALLAEPPIPFAGDAVLDDEALAGTVERVTWRNSETGNCVLRVRVWGRRRPVTVVGHAAAATAGAVVHAAGTWV